MIVFVPEIWGHIIAKHVQVRSLSSMRNRQGLLFILFDPTTLHQPPSTIATNADGRSAGQTRLYISCAWYFNSHLCAHPPDLRPRQTPVPANQRVTLVLLYLPLRQVTPPFDNVVNTTRLSQYTDCNSCSASFGRKTDRVTVLKEPYPNQRVCPNLTPFPFSTLHQSTSLPLSRHSAWLGYTAIMNQSSSIVYVISL